MILLTILVVTLILSLGEINNIIAKFNEIANGNNWVWLLAAIGLALAYFILWPLSQVIFGKALKVSVIISASTMLFIFVIIQFSNAHTIEKYHLYRYINDPSKFWKWTKFWH